MGLSKKPKPPPIPAPAATPQASEAAPEDEAKKAMKRSGYQKTILTGALTPSTGRKTTLG